ncbi:MAG: 2,3-bisphosphoglycerate-independent phosphoglycerate mutase [Candidatus Bathyarchaeia archaeon]
MKAGKGLLIICDGMADRPDPSRVGKTPLEAAETPSIDELARKGLVGIMDVVAPGVPPGSDVAHLSLFGYDPYRYYTGRGGFEAAGAGFDLKPTDVAFRCNFATVDENLVIADRRAGRIGAEADCLLDAIRTIRLGVPGVSFDFLHTVEHRGVLILQGRGLTRAVSDTDPHRTGMKVWEAKPLERSEAARITAKALNNFTLKTYNVLKDHPVNIERVKNGKPPANIILSRGPGTLPSITPLPERFGIRASAIAAVALVRGICRVVGMTLIEVKGATGGVDTDLHAKARAAVKALGTSDLVILHVKAPDVAGHDGNFELKKSVIERIDGMVRLLLDGVEEGTYISLTADHTTPLDVRDHTGDPVPFLISGPRTFPSGVEKFCERYARRGNSSAIRGPDLLNLMMNYMGRVEKFGF